MCAGFDNAVGSVPENTVMKKRTRQILNIGYPPRKSVFWVSGLYPYEFFEAIGVVAGFLDGEINYPPSSTDAMGLSAGFNNGALSSGYLALQDRDAMGLSGGFNDGVLKVVLVTNTMQTEAFGLSAGINDGTLKVVLVTNTMQTEAFGLSGGFNNGTLS